MFGNSPDRFQAWELASNTMLTCLNGAFYHTAHAMAMVCGSVKLAFQFLLFPNSVWLLRTQRRLILTDGQKRQLHDSMRGFRIDLAVS